MSSLREPLPTPDYLLLWKTAKGCGACSYMRGKGIIGETEDGFMSYKSMNEMVKKNIQLINFNYPNMSSNTPTSISVFKRYHKFVRQDVFEKDGDNTKFTRYRCFDQKKTTSSKTVNVKDHKSKPVLWSDFLKYNYPEQTDNYNGYFPMFIFYKYSDWLKSLKNPNQELIGVSNYLKTVRNKFGIVGTDGWASKPVTDSNFVNASNPYSFVDKVVSGQLNINVQENLAVAK